MKLTPEQRESYRTAFIGGYLPLWQFDHILSSEQAWREESESNRDALLEVLDRVHDMESEINGLRAQLNQAIEVLKWYADESKYEKFPYRGDTLTSMNISEPWKYANRILSTLSHEGEKPD